MRLFFRSTSITLKSESLGERLAIVSELSKLRLAALVVFSAIMGYFIAGPSGNLGSLLALTIGGTLVTGGANAFNQVLERVSDAVMQRTMSRPLPQARISTSGAVLLALIMTSCGFLVLLLYCNPLSAVLSLCSLALYVFVYTPLKKKTPLAVFVGAIPGAMPPLLGWVAAKNSVDLEAILLFFLQFLWQFPHFWAIAWRLHEDYQRAGIYLLPLHGGPSVANARLIFLYALFTVPAALLPYVFRFYGLGSMLCIACLGLAYAWPAWKLVKTGEPRDALHVLYASFFYLPLMQIFWLLNF
ncbi:MAG: heme o synthase [Flavobacteriales bacterium]|nr:heme o synthase [Flavobacteriales bacterium]MCX7649732.1 heme o synthase [Flavobacteriales bacterium]MDW8432253.1 heme o synthase [Flavobacteriales bacterium]